MINIKSISMRNFLSYGDYDTTVELSNLGPTIIKGSNGSGKTTLVRAIEWALFGRLDKIAKPGDKVINWDIGKDCIVKLETEDGYKIIRTRKHSKYSGHNDLLIFDKDGNDITSGTNTSAQSLLDKIFNLDYNIFISSIYFGQKHDPFLEMKDKTRRETLEKLLNIENVSIFAQVAKEKHDIIQLKQSKQTTKLEGIERNIENIHTQISRNKSRLKEHEEERKQEIKNLHSEIEEEKQLAKNKKDRKLSEIKTQKQCIKNIHVISDDEIKALEKSWDQIHKVEQAIEHKKEERSKYAVEHNTDSREMKSLKLEMSNWEKKKGTICDKCQQEVTEKHVTDKVNPILNKIQECESRMDHSSKLIKKLNETIKKAEDQVQNYKPNKTVSELKRQKKSTEQEKQQAEKYVEKLRSEYGEIDEDLNNRIKSIQERIDDCKNKENPYNKVISDLEEQLENQNNDLSNAEQEVSRNNTLISHLKYIYSAYNDKRKIRSFILSNLIPMLNQRLKYYLDFFNIDMSIQFNEFLAVKTDKWGYELCSGGQQRCIDLAIMMAIHDLHIAIYGRQCNIMILDEADGELDSKNVKLYSSLIKDELTSRHDKLDSILVMSHKKETWEAFSDQNSITVNYEDKFSVII